MVTLLATVTSTVAFTVTGMVSPTVPPLLCKVLMLSGPATDASVVALLTTHGSRGS